MRERFVSVRPPLGLWPLYAIGAWVDPGDGGGRVWVWPWNLSHFVRISSRDLVLWASWERP